MFLNTAIVEQFRAPHGPLGLLAGHIMANRPSNRQRIAWTLDLLALEPHHRLLEIGCGPGVALAACAAIISQGQAHGIDHSAVMVHQARKRLAREVGPGRVHVQASDLESFTVAPPLYDRVFSLNVIQFLPNIEEAFQKTWRCLARGGLAATTYQPRGKRPTRNQASAMAGKIAMAMTASGFDNIECHELPLQPVPAISVLGRKA